MDRRLAFGFETGPARRLPVDRDDAFRYPGDRRNPSGEAALELSGVQHGEDVAEMIVRGRAVTERTSGKVLRRSAGICASFAFTEKPACDKCPHTVVRDRMRGTAPRLYGSLMFAISSGRHRNSLLVLQAVQYGRH